MYRAALKVPVESGYGGMGRERGRNRGERLEGEGKGGEGVRWEGGERACVTSSHEASSSYEIHSATAERGQEDENEEGREVGMEEVSREEYLDRVSWIV